MNDPMEKPEPPDSTRVAGTGDSAERHGLSPGAPVPRAGLVAEALKAAGYEKKLEKAVGKIVRGALVALLDKIKADFDADEVQADLCAAFLMAAGRGDVEVAEVETPGDRRFPGSEIPVLRLATDFIEGDELVNTIVRSVERTLAGPVAEAAATAYEAVIEGPLNQAVSKSLKKLGVAPTDPAVEQHGDQAYRTHLRRIEALPAEVVIDNVRAPLGELEIKAASGCRRSVEELRNIGVKVANMLERYTIFSGAEISSAAEDAFDAERKKVASGVVRDVARSSVWWPLAVPAIVDNRKALMEGRLSALALGEDLPVRVKPKGSGSGAVRKLSGGSTKGFVLRLYDAVDAKRGKGISDAHRRALEEEDQIQFEEPKKPRELRLLERKKPDVRSWTDAEKDQWDRWVASANSAWERRWLCKAQLLPELTKASVSQWASAMIAFLEAETWNDLEAIHWPSEIKKRAEEFTSDGSTRGYTSAAKEIFKRHLGELASK